jgi:hypothetical protein
MGVSSWSTDPDKNGYADPNIPAVDGAPARKILPFFRGVMAGVAELSSKTISTDILTAGGRAAIAQNDLSLLLGAVNVAKYLTDFMGLVPQDDQIAQAITAAGKGGTLFWPKCPILITRTMQPMIAQRWFCAGSGRSDGGQYDSVDAETAGTNFRFNQMSGTALKLLGNHQRIEHFSVTNNVAGSTATAVQMGDDSGTLNPECQALIDFRMYGFAKQVDVQSGQFWVLNEYNLHNASVYAIRARNESGGGLKMSHTKILGGDIAYHLAIADGVNTSDLFIDSTNSFELQKVAGAVMEAAGPTKNGIYGNIEFDVQLASIPFAAPVTAASGGIIVKDGVVGASIRGMYGSVYNAIQILGGLQINVEPKFIGNALGAGVTIADPAKSVRVDLSFPFSGQSGSYKFVDTRVVDDGLSLRKEVRKFTLNPATSINLWEVGIPAYTAASLKVFVHGLLSNFGIVGARRDVIAPNNGTQVSNPAAVVSADINSKLVPYFDVNSSPGNVIVGVSNTDPVNGLQRASITLEIDGKVSTFRTL